MLLTLFLLGFDGCQSAIEAPDLIPQQSDRSTMLSSFMAPESAGSSSEYQSTGGRRNHNLEVRGMKKISIQSYTGLILPQNKPLKSSSGYNLGQNVSISDNVISLAFGGEAIYSFYALQG
eukprot:428201-Hanusia_phi.AAC.1